MTYASTAPSAAVEGKSRNPGAIVGLNLITLGLYSIYWWYMVNRELRDLGEAHDEPALANRPALATLAYALGDILVVPYVWTVVTTSRRIRAAQQLVGAGGVVQVPIVVSLLCSAALVGFATWGITGWLVVGVIALGAALQTAAVIYMQVCLNEVWGPPTEPLGVNANTQGA